jgi:hypothetical protein
MPDDPPFKSTTGAAAAPKNCTLAVAVVVL